VNKTKIYLSLAKTMIMLMCACFVICLLQSCCAHNNSVTPNFRFPVESFTKIEAESQIKPVQCTPPEGQPNCDSMIPQLPVARSTSLGSGSIVAVQKNGTYVMTAAHVCREPSYQEFVMPNGYKIRARITVKLFVIDWQGRRRAGVEIAADIRNDVCIIKTPSGWGSALTISSEMPDTGDITYNMAAPYGIFKPGMVLLMHGYYSGKDTRNVHFFTIPTKPGSSGSPILNSKGEVVSVIHSAMRSFENVGLGCDLNAIQNIMTEIPPDPIDEDITRRDYLPFFLR
jgi:S1-C subfamily serine protease